MGISNDRYINLKEAAHVSGYAPDYIGQLIRSGKIEGKQVYSNVAWVTTEEAVLSYKNRAKGKRSKSSHADMSTNDSFASVFGSGFVKRLAKAGTYVLVGIGGVFAVFTFYILSIAIEDRLQERAFDRAEAWAESIPIIPDEDPQIPL